MAKADELVQCIEYMVGHNVPDVLTQSTIDPQHNKEIAKRVAELGYKNVRHFCESFPAKFQVNPQFGIISLRGKHQSHHDHSVMNKETPDSRMRKEQWNAKYEDLSNSIAQAVAYNRAEVNTPLNVDPERNAAFVKAAAELGFRSVREFCESYPQRDHFHISPQTGVIALRTKSSKRSLFEKLEGYTVYLDSKGNWVKERKPTVNMDLSHLQAMNINDETPVQQAPKKAPAKTEEKIHFKITHNGVTRRFALPRTEEDLLSALKAHVLKITGTEDVQLFWKDEDSLIVLDCADDMSAAIDFAQTQNKLACVTLETGKKEQKEEKKEEAEKAEAKKATSEDSASAFNGFTFLCDACDAYLAASNGGRYKCTICDNYDLCAACVAKGEHDNHAFILLRNGETEVPVRNDAGAVLSMQTKDAPRCSPIFVVRSGEAFKSADKIFIDVIDSVGKHVGKKMYDTAEWLKKEAEKMNERRKEAEVEEQKMVEEIIRREREEQERRNRAREEKYGPNRTGGIWDTEARREERAREYPCRNPPAFRGFGTKPEAPAAKPTPATPATPSEVEAKLAQTMKDRKMAEQMWREEKRQWRDTRKLFKRQEKELRKENKFHRKAHKESEKSGSSSEEKPAEKSEDKKSLEEEEKERMERFIANPAKAIIEDLLLPAAKSMQAYVALESDTSSDDSDVEFLEKPTEKPVEKSDSIVSDLVVLDDQKQQQEQPSEAAPAAAEAAPAPAPAVAPATVEQPQLPQQQPAAAPAPADPVAPRSYEEELAEEMMRFDRTERRRDPHSIYPELPPFRPEVYEPFGRQRQPYSFVRPNLPETDELFARSHRIPTHMELAVLAKLEKMTVDELKMLLDEFITHLKNNTHSRLRHSPVFVTNGEVSDDDLIRMIAVDLTARLQSMKKIVNNATPSDVHRMIQNRILELRAAINNGEYDAIDQAKAEALYPILLTAQYTGRFGMSSNPFGDYFGRHSQRRGDFRRGDRNRESWGGFGGAERYGGQGWNSYLPSFMQAPAASVASAVHTTAAAAASAAQAAAAAAAASRAPAPSAPAVAAETANAENLNAEQKKVLRQLFDTGMFEDYERMVEVCRKAQNLDEAIDMMLQ